MLLYVTVSDGKLTAKNEVFVNIVNGTAASNRVGGSVIRPPFYPLPNFGHRQPPPLFPTGTTPSQKIRLQPVTPFVATATTEDTPGSSHTPVEVVNVTTVKTEETVRSPPDLTVTLVPVVSVCAVFLTVVILAVVFRNRIYWVRTKNTKDDMVISTSNYYDFNLQH